MASDCSDHRNEAFGVDISPQMRACINRIRNNDPTMTAFRLWDARFSDRGWELLGRYITNNTHLTDLELSHNKTINSDCFRGILEALDGSSVEKLDFDCCSITAIRALANCNLPRLKKIDLQGNKICSVPSLESFTSLEIGNEGCRSIAKLLANESSSLRELSIYNNRFGDEGAEILASSLKLNTRLETLSLSYNDITERGLAAFLKLLNDVSSIESTCRSNQTLRYFSFDYTEIVKKHIDSALKINKESEGNPHAAGRAKVIATQLDSTTREEICHLQGIWYSFSTLFAGIDPVVLPDLLALAGSAHGQNELYCMLIVTGPHLANLIDKESMIEATMAKNVALNKAHDAQIKVLDAQIINARTTENLDMEERLELLRNSPPSLWSNA